MINREKVISGLQHCRLMNKLNCDKCPYDYNGRGNGKSECTAELASDVLVILKAQEKEIENLKEIIKNADEALESIKEKINELLYEDFRRYEE